MTGPKPQAPPLAFIQLAFFLGPVMFAAVVYFLHHQPGATWPGLPAGAKYALQVLYVLAVSGVVAVYRIRANAKDDQQFASLTIIGWALGEAAALGGCVYYFMTNNVEYAALGIIVVQGLSFVFLPVRRPS